MAKKSPKPVPMRSVRSGKKKRKLIESNLLVIKSIEKQILNS